MDYSREDVEKVTKYIVSEFNKKTGGHYKHLAESNVLEMEKCLKLHNSVTILSMVLETEITDLKEFFKLVQETPKTIDDDVDDDIDDEPKEDNIQEGERVFVRDDQDEEWSERSYIFLGKAVDGGYIVVSPYSEEDYINGEEYLKTPWNFVKKVEDDDIKTPEINEIIGNVIEEEPPIEEETPKGNDDMIDAMNYGIEKIEPTIKKGSEEPTFKGNSGMDLLVNSLANGMCDTILSKTQKNIDEYVTKTYGTLPKIIKVNTEGKENTVTGIVHEVFEDVITLVTMKIPVFLIGKAGTGKNVICKQVAEGLGLEFYFSNAVTQEYKITGFIDANGTYQKTQFYEAFKNGGLFFLDEMDASVPEVLIILNAAIANGYFDFPCGKIKAHKDFRVIAAGNTFGKGADYEYTGRNALDSASLDRFAIVEVDYSKKIEMAISGNDRELVTFFREWRKACDKCGVSCVASYRGLEYLAKLEPTLGLKKAMKMSLLKNLTKDDVLIISKALNNSKISDKYLKELRNYAN